MSERLSDSAVAVLLLLVLLSTVTSGVLSVLWFATAVVYFVVRVVRR